MSRRSIAAITCLIAFVAGFMPAAAQDEPASTSDHVLALMNGQSCAIHEYNEFERDVEAAQVPAGSRYVAQFNVTPSPSPSPTPFGATPTPFPGPTFAPRGNSTTTLYATPRPTGSPGATPYPLPTATVNPWNQNQPVFVERGGSTPPPITPAGYRQPTPGPAPTGVPTLAPNYIAVLADKVTGNTKPGEPGEATGNVHILYGAEEIVGEQAHYDGLRTITITGHPFIINHAKDSVLEADKITFDTIDQTAVLTNGRGTSNEGVQHGLVHFQANNLHTDAQGVGHGLKPYVTTCEHARGGYHITGRNMDVYPGDKIVIYQAILWLGAAAIFWLPKVVIPLRQVATSERTRYFPDVGYDEYEGFWIKTMTAFGRDKYFYGYYEVNYFTKVGLGLGYIAYYTKKNGRRTASINFYTIHDKRVDQTNNNLTLTETENISHTLRANFNVGYQSNFGPYTDLPADTSINATVAHQTMHSSQQYSFSRTSVGSQSSTDSFSFTDNQQFNTQLSNAFNFTQSSSSSNFGGVGSSNSSATIDDLLHYTTSAEDYQLTYDKTFSQQPYGIDELPQLQIRPYKWFPHFVIPTSANFTVGEYNEPQENGFSDGRADMAFVLGPEIAQVFGSDLQGTIDVNQYAYSTGDLKASTTQNFSLISPISQHFVNTITYSEANYAGPSDVPFTQLDQLPTSNTKNAQDLLRILNGNVYNFSVGYSTNFEPEALPVTYQLTVQPTSRSILLLSGSYTPNPSGAGSGGFGSTNLQLSTPFGKDQSIELVTDIDWRNKARLEDKVIYFTKTIGNCYQLQILYNQSMQLVSAQINILAFPTQGAAFSVGQAGPIVPTNFNF